MIRIDATTVEPIVTPHGAVALRPEAAADTSFLLALHDSVKGAALPPLPEPMRRQLLDMQFRAMTEGYRAGFPSGCFDIITLNEAPIGRLITDMGASGFHIVHVALLPEWRRRGITLALMTVVLDRPRSLGLTCEATVALDNLPSQRLWSRLGFTERGRDAANLVVEWRSV